MPRLRLGSLILLAASTSCSATEPGAGGSGGRLQLVTATAGTQPDSDGYTIMVDGTPHGTIGSNDSVTVAGVAAGSHAVELAGIGFNCATLGEFTRSVSVAADAKASVDYTVSCDAVSRSRIAFVSGSLDPKVLIMNADGSDTTSLTDSLGAVFADVNSFRPPVSWSGDGSRLAYAFVSSAPGAFFNPGRLHVVNVDGTGQMNLTPVDDVWQPAWSPDGTRIAYAGEGHIFVANADGSGRTDVANGRLPTWTGR
jgi:hypothetical protein